MKAAVAEGPGASSGCSAVPKNVKSTPISPKLTRLPSGGTSPNATRCGVPAYRSTLAAIATMRAFEPVEPIGPVGAVVAGSPSDVQGPGGGPDARGGRG